MEKELKDKFVTALRSGEYEQNRWSLRKPNASDGFKYCCLGVLAVVAGLEMDRFGENIAGYSGIDGYKPLKNLVGQDNEISCLMRMNDVYNNSFSEIADYVEKVL